jgi:putative ABC transport system substrate-binding protein
MNKRRELVVALGASALVAPLARLAQSQDKVWRVGYLTPNVRPTSLESSSFIGATFFRGLRDLGYVEGKNLAIESRFADDKLERLPGMAAELVKMQVDVILTVATPATEAAHRATSTIPIVMVNVGDPVASGFVKSLARPSGNITGLTTTNADIGPKYLEMLRGIAPKLFRVAVLLNHGNRAQANFLKNIKIAAQRINMSILPLEVRTPTEIDNAFVAMAREKAEAVVVSADLLFVSQQTHVAELAMRYRLPSISGRRSQVEAGLLMSYGPKDADTFRRAAAYVDKILKGAKPSNLPVEQPTEYELSINDKTAKALGLRIPQALLLRADEVIR